GAGAAVLGRVVGGVVAEGRPRGGGAQGPAQDLGAQADADQGDSPDRLPAQLDGPLQRGRVAGSVRQQQRAGARGADVGPGGGVRQDDDPAAALAQRAQYVGLDAVV